MSSTSLNGKAALVTGGSRGIGRAITLALAAQGARVAFTYASNRTAADEVTASAGAGPGAAAPLEADLRSPEQASTLLARAREALEQPVDVLVCNAGLSLFGPFGQFTLEDFEQSFAVNARATFLLLSAAATDLADGGRIVTVSTGGTAAPLGPDGVYAASKAAGELLTVAAARQLGARGITANIVAPGLTETSGMVLPPEQVQQMTAATPLGRLGQPDDIADVVVFLAGPAARWITGQRIQVSGGLR